QVPGVIRWEPAQTTQLLDYQEQSAMLAVNQLIGGEWSLGARYRFSRAELDIRYADVASSVGGSRQSTRSDLHEFGFNLLYSHPSGFFARAEAGWFMQSNWETDHDTPGSGQVELPDDEFPLINLLLGYRFPRQRGDVTLGLLNASGEDYHLNPLNAHPEFPHERVWMARLRLSF
ncbi:MAG TPA: hypothetical protein VNO52_17195, partial [Methylomirabilota bacterium]|nr:hypothetical protein [Methylomirabilota bacterium]